MKDNKNYSNVERRDFKRLKVDFSFFYQINKPWYVLVLISGEEVEAVALDLSEGGMAFSTNCDIRAGTGLSMKIMIYKQDKENNFKVYKTIKARGKVCSNVLEDTNKHRIGINFTEIDQEGKKELIDFAQKKPKRFT